MYKPEERKRKKEIIYFTKLKIKESIGEYALQDRFTYGKNVHGDWNQQPRGGEREGRIMIMFQNMWGMGNASDKPSQQKLYNLNKDRDQLRNSNHRNLWSKQ